MRKKMKPIKPDRCFYLTAFLPLVFALLYNSYADDADIGIALLMKGDLEKATLHLAAAYAFDSTRPDVSLAYASTVYDGQVAVTILNRVWADTSATLPQKGEAAAKLGDAAFASGNYALACGWYDSSLGLIPGNAETAKKKNRAAKTAGIDSGYGKIEQKVSSGPVFMFQLGAFSSIENARKYAKDMEKHIDNITIAPVTSGANVLYRVRAGRFQSETEAREYAKTNLESRGISFRIVTE
jgi:tetratricopeptide (TPR) repeat protein